MQIRIASSNARDASSACDEVIQTLADGHWSLIIAGFNTEHDASLLQQRLTQAFDCPIMAGSSCLGALGIEQQTQAQAGLVLWALADHSGNYGVGACSQGDDPRQAAQQALEKALAQSGREYESPALLWCILPPGQEECVLQGFSDVVGPNVPVLGGSSADNDVSGQWQQFHRQGVGVDLIQVAVFFPSGSVGVSFSSGYQPSGQTLVATQVAGRQLMELDGQPAAQRFNQCIDGAIEQQLEGGNVLALTTLHPLGRCIPMADGPDDYLLSHPDAVTESGALTLFSEVAQDESLELMTGSIDGLVNRAGKVLENARQLLPKEEKPVGALMIYCAGCMLTIGEQVHAMAADVHANAAMPIMGLYTFGEQGCFVDGQNRHGNLMISAVVFGQ
ncbi:FIST signal transduction protein [Bacterioplanes sanyensis]|nr:FIST N-terminal domain-containing protein [Bacterioplanes sanyensis]